MADANEIRNRLGEVVGTTDRAYEVEGVGYIAFDEILLQGELATEIQYRGRNLQVVHIHTMVGMQVDHRGARGPLAKGVFCQVVGVVNDANRDR